MLVNNLNLLINFNSVLITFCIFISRKKSQLLDDEITVIKNKEKIISLSCFKSENNLSAVLKTFLEEVNKFGSITNKLHDHVSKQYVRCKSSLENYN